MIRHLKNENHVTTHLDIVNAAKFLYGMGKQIKIYKNICYKLFVYFRVRVRKPTIRENSNTNEHER